MKQQQITLLICAVSAIFAALPAKAAIMDHDVDPENLGTGQWIYFLSQATNRLGGNVESVTDIPSLMRFYKKSGIDFVVVKSGTGAKLFPTEKPQFTKELVDEAHAAGLKIFGYTRSHGRDVPGEIALAANNYDLGADGFVIDAEAEWESHNLKDGPQKAVQLCKGIKQQYPNKFLGHAPFPIISFHRSFPYQEFGLYCDAVMPQAYWKSIKVSPTRMVEWMNDEWNAWHKSLTPQFKKAIKPIAPIGQGWSPDSDRILDPVEILEFVAALNNCSNSASPTGYKGVSYWRTDLHTSGMWRSIRKEKIGDASSTPRELVSDESSNRTKKNSANKPSKQAPKVVESPNDFVMDNDHPDVSLIGEWYTRKGNGLYGEDYFCANTTGNGSITATVVYRPLIQNPGLYDVYIWYVPHENRSTEAPWFISYEGGSEIVAVDQATGGHKWHRICEAKPFSPGSEGFVSVSNDTVERGKVVVADAVRFVRRDNVPVRTSANNK
ncbi:MAG: hypothetical protein H0X66_14680 [Verrucomicrobia bacterium]|nr:hypothetical protein [Verrucomicrobiota bacterium]